MTESYPHGNFQVNWVEHFAGRNSLVGFFDSCGTTGYPEIEHAMPERGERWSGTGFRVTAPVYLAALSLFPSTEHWAIQPGPN